MKEFEIIKKFFLPLASNTKNHSTKNTQTFNNFDSLQLQDDIAIIQQNQDSVIVVSKDIFIENIHFLKSDGAKKIASKLILSNISDIASSGAKPLCYLLGFSKNQHTDSLYIKNFCQALKTIQTKYNLSLIGGDTSQSQQLFYSITIFGEAPKGKILLRKNAEDGDLIYVSNTIGDAFLGLNIKLKNLKKPSPQSLKDFEKKLLKKHFYPTPRIALAQKLLEYNLSKCATDISDGLIADLSNICNASKLNAKIFLDQIPLSNSSLSYLKKHEDYKIEDLISGGDDYELIFTIKARDVKKIKELEKELNLQLTCIGLFENNPQNKSSKRFEVQTYQSQNQQQKPLKLKKKGYEH